jgi:hypothetical protein
MQGINANWHVSNVKKLQAETLHVYRVMANGHCSLVVSLTDSYEEQNLAP